MNIMCKSISAWGLLVPVRLIYCLILFSQPVCAYRSPGVIVALSEPWNLGRLFLEPAWLLKLLAKCKSLTYDHFRAVKLDFRAAIPLVSLSHSRSVVMPEYLYMWKWKFSTIYNKLYTLQFGSWPNLPIGLWPSWPSKSSPYTDWLHYSVCSSPVSWCVEGVLVQYGCCIWWWLRRFPLLCKALWVPEKCYIM